MTIYNSKPVSYANSPAEQTSKLIGLKIETKMLGPCYCIILSSSIIVKIFQLNMSMYCNNETSL